MPTNNVIVKLTNVGTNISSFFVYGFNSSNPNVYNPISPTIIGKIEALAGFTASFDSANGYDSIKLVARDTVCFPSSSTVLITSTTPPPVYCETNGSTVGVQNIGNNRLIVSLIGTPGADAANFNIYSYQTAGVPHYLSGSFTLAQMQGGVNISYASYPADLNVIISGSRPCASFRISGSIPAPPANCNFPDIIAIRRGDNGVNVSFNGTPGTDLGPFDIYAYPNGATIGPSYRIGLGITRNQLLASGGWPSPNAVAANYDRVMVSNTGVACSTAGSKVTTLAPGASNMEININNSDQFGSTALNANRRIVKLEFTNTDGVVTTINQFYDQATGVVSVPAPISSSRYFSISGLSTAKSQVKAYILPGDYNIKVYVSASSQGNTLGTDLMNTNLACWMGWSSLSPQWNDYYPSDNYSRTGNMWIYTFIGGSTISSANGGYLPEYTGSYSSQTSYIKVRPQFFVTTGTNPEPFIINFSTAIQNPAQPITNPNCVDPYTNILLTKEGTNILAKDLKVGDIIYTYNYKKGFKTYGYYEITYHKIEYSPKRILISFDDGSSMITSTSHNFMLSDSTWRQVFEFNGNETVKGIDIDKKVINMKDIGDGQVVAMSVNSAQTYIANGLVSHNFNVDGGGGGVSGGFEKIATGQ